MMIVPVLILDVTIEIYHRICFVLYDLPYVNRSAYIKLDRYKLPYLSWGDKLNCLYCEYVNGFFHYSVAIAGETEKYWCGIKHQNVEGFNHPEHHKEFLEYNDKESFEKHCKMQKKK
jgi:hypothetical protein